VNISQPKLRSEKFGNNNNNYYYYYYYVILRVKGKYQQTMKTQREVEVQLYSFFNLGARYEWLANATLRPLSVGKRPGTDCTGGCVGPNTGTDGCEKCFPHRDSIPAPSSP